MWFHGDTTKFPSTICGIVTSLSLYGVSPCSANNSKEAQKLKSITLKLSLELLKIVIQRFKLFLKSSLASRVVIESFPFALGSSFVNKFGCNTLRTSMEFATVLSEVPLTISSHHTPSYRSVIVPNLAS